MTKIKLSTGLKTYEIEDENGNLRGTISFNPSDFGLVTRAKELVENVNNILNSLADVEDGEVSEDFVIEEMKRIDADIKAQINMLFDDENTSNVVFGNQLVFNTLNGVTFVERFLDVFIPIIEKEVKAEMKKSANKIEKYTSQVK